MNDDSRQNINYNLLYSHISRNRLQNTNLSHEKGQRNQNSEQIFRLVMSAGTDKTGSAWKRNKHSLYISVDHEGLDCKQNTTCSLPQRGPEYKWWENSYISQSVSIRPTLAVGQTVSQQATWEDSWFVINLSASQSERSVSQSLSQQVSPKPK